MNFKDGHLWHSHTAILEIKVDEKSCWVCNENIANFIYEPFILQQMEQFPEAKSFMALNGINKVGEYWDSSLSFEDNLSERRDRKRGYDAEVLVMHHIPPGNLRCVRIISDHQNMTYEQWKEFFGGYKGGS